MDKVTALHQHKVLVVAPTVGLSVAFPFGGALALTLGIDVEVGHGQIEQPVGTAEDVRVAHAALFSNGVAVDDGLVLVEGMEGVAVFRNGHVDGVGVVFVIDQQVAPVALSAHGERTEQTDKCYKV